MSVRTTLRAWIPPAVLEARRRWLGARGLRFSDEPGGWAAARARSKGYATDLIVDSVAQATREVQAGRAVFERDSVLFHQADYRYEVVAALLRTASLQDGCLDVIDCGGSLGSTYRQCRPLLTGLRRLRWRVLEQAHFVAAGRREFTTDELSFASSVAELPDFDAPPLLLLSSVLQYLEDPMQMLRDLLRLKPAAVVVDRTPLSEIDEHRLTVQHVPKAIYDASYPCWILSRRRLLQVLSEEGLRIVGQFPCPEGSFTTDSGFQFEFRGLIAEREIA
ncbi:MAG: methyltransferase, TIGR04325 family [Burkholderiaceae bacterium]|nr:methyltransferase, TIGR04325 family [Burkholderiaceae bacterium]